MVNKIIFASAGTLFLALSSLNAQAAGGCGYGFARGPMGGCVRVGAAVVAPGPVVVAPRPVVVAPRPVIVGRPVVVGPRPVVVGRPVVRIR